MSRGYGGPAVASTSRQPHPSLPAKPRLQGEFKQQDDFISFNDALSDEEGRDYRGKGKGRDFGGPRGKKRTIGEVLDEQGKRKLKDIEKTTPWTADVDWDAHASATQQLSAEVRAFTEYISPTDQEHELRTCVVESIRRLITSRWRDAQVHAFGSFETRLYLPTGDIDLVIVSPSISREKNAQKRILFQISGLLKSARLGTDIVVIGKARVPIVKFVTVQGGFKVDISLNMMNGIHVGRRVTQLFKEVGEGPARSLIMVTKAFLSQRNMNEVYSGGLGSYSIICLVVSFLQLHPKLQKKEIDPDENLGTLLIEFLELYGKHFNFEEVGICVSSGGSYYSKSERGWARPNQPYLLSIEDPADPTNDVAGGSHNIKAVQMSLGGAFEVLSYAVYVRTSIILARIAAAQSGRRLPTLSGRAILEPVGEGEDDVDECRKSLLGSIVGVTAEIEKSRTGARTLASTGVVQQSVGVTPGNFDERGQLDNPAARAAKAAQAAKVRARAVQNTTAPSVPQPKAPESISGDSHTSSKRKARKLAKAQAASQPNQKDKAAAKAEAAQVVEAAQDGAYAQSSRRPTPVPAVKAPTYINLDSDSESDIAPAPAKHTAVARTKGKAVESDSSDSRYAVKKGRNGTKAADTQYKPNGQNKKSDDNSDSDSDVVLVASSKKGSIAGTSQKANKASTSAATTASPKKRPRKAKQKAKVATSSDMEMSSSESSSVKPEAKQPAKASTAKKGKGKATSPQVKRLAQRKEFWSAKGQVNNHSISSDSDSDNVYVRSK